MKKILPLILFFLVFAISCRHRDCPRPQSSLPKPKLVIGVVTDQMRWDYFYRYSGKYSENGLKRLLREGHSCANTHIPYSPSYTGPGHACVYTGSVPAIHGITGNSWYDYKEGKIVNCVEDNSMTTVGAASSTGKKSPQRMFATTVTDELRLATNFQAKVIGVALKDRSAILPAGHAANAAYFFDGASGNWITSSYYGMQELPAWVNQFNGKKLPAEYLAKNWNTLLPLADYTESDKDAAEYERAFSNEKSPVFEHKVSELTKTGYDVIGSTPYGNALTLQFAEAAITGENLGTDTTTDFLTVSLSSPDLIGHQFGPNSVEIQDCYLRLDKDIEGFLSFLDERIGKGNYLLFLTADHGAAHAPGYLKENKIPGGVFPMDSVERALAPLLAKQFGTGEWILSIENMQVYLNNALIAERKVNRAAIKKTIRDFLMQQKGISNVFDLENLANENIVQNIRQAIINGVYPGRSGDLYVLHNPAWFDHLSKGTTHGSVYPYDTRIALVWFGWHIRPGEDFSETYMTDIAPTVAALLHIQEPNGCVGKPINAVLQFPKEHSCRH